MCTTPGVEDGTRGTGVGPAARAMLARDSRVHMQATREELERLYAEHPLRGSTVLARVLARGGRLAALTERDLSEDRATGITDQNHVGGARAVRRLGRLAGVSGTDVVADLGCGLGGPARVLACTFGCRVEGFDLSRSRVDDANALTKLVGLGHLVSARAGDVMRMRVPRAAYDVLWGQGAWVHIDDKRRLIERWRPALRPGGRVALEDTCTRRAPRGRLERALLARLERDWASSLIALAEWVALLEGAGFRVVTRVQSARELAVAFERFGRAAARANAAVPPRERRSWRDAEAGARHGLLVLFRIVAVAPRASSRHVPTRPATGPP
jgi:SAM-dependent methyltransferase